MLLLELRQLLELLLVQMLLRQQLVQMLDFEQHDDEGSLRPFAHEVNHSF